MIVIAVVALLVAQRSAAIDAVPLDYVLIGSGVVPDVDPRLGLEIGSVGGLADCAALCSRDAHCESLLFTDSRCVLYAIRACQFGGLVPSAKGGLVLEKAANVPIDDDRVVIRSSSCARYENGTLLDAYDGQVKATFDDGMNTAVADFTTACHMHCAKTTFCQSYTVDMSWDAVPAQVNLRCSAFANSIYSGDGSALRVSDCERRQLTYGIHGRALSHVNCGRPLPAAPSSGGAGVPPGFALVAEHEYIDADSAGDVFGALSAASCAALCARDSDCEAFVYSAKLERCQLFNVRHCMVAYSSLPGDWTFWGDVYERANPVTVSADRLIFDADCGEYSGVVIGSADVGNFTDKAQTCRQLCSVTTAPHPCRSWEVQAFGPTNATCRLFADSLFSTAPLGGYYSTNRGLCSTRAQPYHSTYGLAAQATSVLNCGRTPRPSLAKGGGGDGGLPPKGTAKPPAVAAPTPVAAPAGKAAEAGATPSPQDSHSAATTASAFAALVALAVGLVLL